MEIKVDSIIKYPDERLFAVSTPCESVMEGVLIAHDIGAALDATTWGNKLGIAAPQIGVNKRVFIAMGETFINPEIVWQSGHKVPQREGCYSLEEGKDYEVERPYGVTLVWTNELGEKKTNRFNGLKAEVILHEFDHLEGRLCGKPT